MDCTWNIKIKYQRYMCGGLLEIVTQSMQEWAEKSTEFAKKGDRKDEFLHQMKITDTGLCLVKTWLEI